MKSNLKHQNEVYLQKFPNTSIENIITRIKLDMHVPMLQGVKRKTLNKIFLYQQKRFSFLVYMPSCVEVMVVY